MYYVIEKNKKPRSKNTVKSFNFVGMKFCCLTIIDMFVVTSIRGFLNDIQAYLIK